jgi:hypothetical protein
VDWDANRRTAIPLGKIKFLSGISPEIRVIPVVYITNKTFLNLNHTEIKLLTSKVVEQVYYIAKQNKLSFTEIQFDCDWTESTRLKYFSFIDNVKKLIDKHIKLSATIRLHQVKYYKLTGIPPVQRGMLMFYNMGKIDNCLNRNSIYNSIDVQNYTPYLKNYPLALDAVLPAFSWGIQIRKGKIIGLLNNLNSSDFKNNTNFKYLGKEQYQVTKSFFYNGFYFMDQDLVQVEEITPEICKNAAKEVSGAMKSLPGTIALFHLDSTNLTNYEKKDFEEIFNCFR